VVAEEAIWEISDFAESVSESLQMTVKFQELKNLLGKHKQKEKNLENICRGGKICSVV
jgi:hypothetical protein